MSDDRPTSPDPDPFRGPWFTSKTAAAYVGSKTIWAYYVWRRRHGIPKRSNHTVAKADLDRALKFKAVKATGGSTRHPNSLANIKRKVG